MVVGTTGQATMFKSSGKPQYDDPQSDEDGAVADSGNELTYRRLAVSSGETTGIWECYLTRAASKNRSSTT